MKLVYCIQSTYNSGGMERVLSNKANYWVAQGHEVSIITTDQKGRESFFYFDPRIKHYDLDVNFAENNGQGLLSKLLQFPLKQWRCRKRMHALLNKLSADIVVSMFDNEAPTVASARDGSKKVLEIHFARAWRELRNRGGLWKWVDRYRTRRDAAIAAKFDQFVVLTKEDRSNWPELRDVVVIPNALTFEPEQRSSLSRKRVLAVGRMTYQKNFESLVNIWARVAPRHPDWILSIVGHGEEEPEIRRLVKLYGLEQSLEILPQMKEMERMYLDSSVMVLSSRYEGLPMVLLEAQAFGLPIVSYACPCGPRDIITEGEDGYLVPPGDEEIFAERLEELLGDPALLKQMGLNARSASQRFTPREVMREWEELFASLLKR